MKRLLKWLALTLVGVVIVLAAPLLYIETACRPQGEPVAYEPLLPEEDHRPEARTLLTYPEWHIVHAYDDYAAVIAEDDPHDFGFLRAIGGFWSSLCALSQASGPHGGFEGPIKTTIYTIGVSFTAELLAKAAYEETLGRVATLLRGAERAPLDDLSAQQAASYATFLQQVPWYKWDFATDRAALVAASSGSLRDRERALALGLEYRAKGAYAGLIEQAVAQMEPDALRLKMVVSGLDDAALKELPDVTLLDRLPEGAVIDTPRYRALTRLLAEMARSGADFVEIAGNDDILFTALSGEPSHPQALHSFARQGYGDYRHLILLPVRDLADALRTLPETGLSLEHIHDY